MQVVDQFCVNCFPAGLVKQSFWVRVHLVGRLEYLSYFSDRLLLSKMCLPQPSQDFRLILLKFASLTIFLINESNLFSNLLIPVLLCFHPFLNCNFFRVYLNSVLNYANLLYLVLHLFQLTLLQLRIFLQHLAQLFPNDICLLCFDCENIS